MKSVKHWLGLTTLLTLCSVSSASAQTYTLYTESHCAHRGLDLTFKCIPMGSPTSPSKLVITKESASKWVANEGGKTFPLNFIKEDKEFLALDYPVLYSGMAHIVLMKETGRFYLTEVAYSSVLKIQSYDVEKGRFDKKN